MRTHSFTSYNRSRGPQDRKARSPTVLLISNRCLSMREGDSCGWHVVEENTAQRGRYDAPTRCFRSLPPREDFGARLIEPLHRVPSSKPFTVPPFKPRSQKSDRAAFSLPKTFDHPPRCWEAFQCISHISPVPGPPVMHRRKSLELYPNSKINSHRLHRFSIPVNVIAIPPPPDPEIG